MGARWRSARKRQPVPVAMAVDDIYPAIDTRSKVNHWKVPETCAQCHQEIAREFNESVHGEAVKAGVRDAPVCVDCHGEHLIMDPKSAGSPLNAVNVSAETCGRCHGDPRSALRNDLPADRLPSYAESYHGLAVKEGKVTAANCASCHGVHDILRSSDPRSTVNPANLRKTCGECHKVWSKPNPPSGACMWRRTRARITRW